MTLLLFILLFMTTIIAQQEQQKPRRYLGGEDSDIARVVDELVALVPSLPKESTGKCRKQRYSRLCACSSGIAFNSEQPTFAPDKALLAVLERETEMLTFFRNMCLVDESIHTVTMRIMCALEQRPCDQEGETINARDARKLCRSDCLAVKQRLETLAVNVKGIIQILLALGVTSDIDPTILPLRCQQIWTNFTGSCLNDDVFSDDAATCMQSPANTTELAAPLYGWRRRICLSHAAPAAQSCRTDAKFESAMCLGTDGKMRPAVMSTNAVDVHVSDQVGSMRVLHKQSGETLGFRVLRIANAESNFLDHELLRWVEKSLTTTKPSLTCGDFAADGRPRAINATFVVSPTCSVVMRYIVVDEARRIPVFGYPDLNFTLPPDAAKVSMLINGDPFGAAESVGLNRFIVEFALELAPFSTIVPTFNHPTLYKPTDDVIGEERLDLELSKTQLRYKMPLVAVSDNVAERFQIGLVQFTEFAQHFLGRACPSIRFEARMNRFTKSVDIDPSLELIVDGYVDEAERERIDNEISLREPEMEPTFEVGDGATIAASIIVVLLLIIGGGGLVFWLHRSGRLKLRTERGGVQ
jgi:hypothetical protein